MFAAEKFWILDPLYAAFGSVLAWCYSLIPSFGVAIMLLTVAVSIIRMPLVAKQVRSQREMQRIQPELKRIQAKYKTEPQKRNEEMMKLYKEHNVNPFAGCLPLLLQMPLFIVLYRLILDLGRPDPKHIPGSSQLFRALQAAGGKMESFGMDLAESASKAGSGGFANLLPYLVLIALVIGTGIFQQRQMTARLPKESMNSQIAIMGKIFPIFLGFISWTIPAGVVVYFFVSNLWQIGQQAYLFRHKEEDKPVGAGASGKGKVITADRVRDDEPETNTKARAKGAKSSGATTRSSGARPAKNDKKQPAAGGRGNGRAAGRNLARGDSTRKGDKRGADGARGGGATNGRGASSGRGASGGGGRAQAKGTAPQGRSRPRKGK